MNPESSRNIPLLSEKVVPSDIAVDSPISVDQPNRSSVQPALYKAGDVIGDRYRLVREIGQGGMGVVWVAHSLVLGIDVALKLMRASVAGPGVSSRMAREAHATAQLSHPALVRVFDFGWTTLGDPYLVMELVVGETLSALLCREQRVDAIRAVQMILPVADGLRVAHDKHIIHRDIKPDNIFLATDPFGRAQPKLFDFGIAKIDPTVVDPKLTQVGVVLGSPEYMSPEQALGLEDVDERTDVWSLAVVLYELLTGDVPFSRPNYNALMQAIIHDDPAPIVEHAAGDGSLWSVLASGLAKDRAARWANMTEFGEALAQWLYEQGVTEDLSGNSIRAVWLDGPLSGVRNEALSAPMRSAPLMDDTAALSRRAREIHTVAAAVAASARSTQKSERLPRAQRRRAVWAIVLLAAVALGVVAARAHWNASVQPSVVIAEPPTSPAIPVVDPSSLAAIPSPSSTLDERAEPMSADQSELDEPKRPAKPASSTRPRRASKRTHDFGF